MQFFHFFWKHSKGPIKINQSFISIFIFVCTSSNFLKTCNVFQLDSILIVILIGWFFFWRIGILRKPNNFCWHCHFLTYHLVPRAIWPYYVKWIFSTFCGLSRSTNYPYLPQGRIGPLDPRSGVQIYPMANLLHKIWKQKYPPPNSDFWKNLTIAWFWPIIWHISNPEPSDTF